MRFDENGAIILNHDLCLTCQREIGAPHLCSSCQWARAMDWLSKKEAEHKAREEDTLVC